MLVFIDESGDPGFKLEKGSSPLFVVAMTIFESDHDAQSCGATIDSVRASLNRTREFSFHGSSDSVKDAFFSAVSQQKFRVRALVVDKSLIHSDYLRCNHRQFYNYVVKSVLSHHEGTLINARVRVDRCGKRAFRDALASYIRKSVPEVKKLTFVRSDGDNLIQLADMVVGAIARRHRGAKPRDCDWRNSIAHLIQDEWQFR
jgi:hypothetical protein